MENYNDSKILEELENKVNKENGKELSSNDFTNEDKSKLDGIEKNAQKNDENTVIDSNYVHTDNNYTNEEKSKLNKLENYDDSIIKEKIETLENNVNDKVDKIEGKGLSSNDFTTDDKNKLDKLENYDDTETKNEIEKLKRENSDIKNNQLYGDTEGESITLNDSADMKYKIDVLGNISQNQYEGYNLLNSQIKTVTSNGITVTYDENDNSITFNGTCTANNTSFRFSNFDVSCKTTETLYLKLFHESGTISKISTSEMFGVYNSSWKGNGILLNRITNKQAPAVYTQTAIGNSDIEYTMCQFRFDTGNVLNNFKVKAMITKKNTDVYEPYVGGKTSPSPTYPQEIKTVTGTITIKMQNKNLFDKSNVIIGYRLGSDGELFEDKNCATSEFFEVKNNSNYYVNIGSNYNNAIAYYDENKKFISRITDNSKKLTTPKNCKYVRKSCLINEINSIQFEQGIEETKYVEYQKQNYNLNLGNIELCINDFIDGTPDNWYLNKTWGKIIPDYNFKSQFGMLQTDYFQQQIVVSNFQNGKIICSHYPYKSNNWLSQDYSVAPSGTNNVYIAFQIPIELLETQDVPGVRKYFQKQIDEGNPIIVYYQLQTPTREKITDETLIKQLNDLYENARTYKNVTHIDSEVEEGNAKPILQVEYVKDLQTVIDNLTSMIVNNATNNVINNTNNTVINTTTEDI